METLKTLLVDSVFAHQGGSQTAIFTGIGEEEGTNSLGMQLRPAHR